MEVWNGGGGFGEGKTETGFVYYLGCEKFLKQTVVSCHVLFCSVSFIRFIEFRG